MKAIEIFHQKQILNHRDGDRFGIFEIRVWKIPISKYYPSGVKYRAWLSEDGETVFGFDNHKPKGPHLHIRDLEVGYVFRNIDALREDIEALIEKEGFVYEG